MGQTYSFKETGGVIMDFAVRSRADIEKLSVEQVCEKLSYVDAALRIVRKELGEETALLGFTGSPWTLATFMMEGASVPKYSRALQLFREDKQLYFALAEKLTAAVAAYLKMQIAAGIDGLQIFDSHGGHLLPAEFQEASGRWMAEIISQLPGRASGYVRATDANEMVSPFHNPVKMAGTNTSPRPSPHLTPPPLSNAEREKRSQHLGDVTPLVDQGTHARISGWEKSSGGASHPAEVPVIVFSLGTHGNWPDLVASGADVIGIDWQTSLAEARQNVPPHLALQGNLAPALLAEATPAVVATETAKVLEAMRGRPGHIFNLGHGLTPAAKLENIAALVETVKGFK
jgi:uroporphyrinogen-III decarboxylase